MPPSSRGGSAKRTGERVPAGRVNFITALMRCCGWLRSAAARARRASSPTTTSHERCVTRSANDVKVGDRRVVYLSAQRMQGIVWRQSAKPRVLDRSQSKKFRMARRSSRCRSIDPCPLQPEIRSRAEREAAGIERECWYRGGCRGLSRRRQHQLLRHDCCRRTWRIFAPKARRSSAAISTGGRRIGSTRPTCAPLLDPTVDMGPMATLLLAVGLAGKEAGRDRRGGGCAGAIGASMAGSTPNYWRAMSRELLRTGMPPARVTRRACGGAAHRRGRWRRLCSKCCARRSRRGRPIRRRTRPHCWS